MVLEIGERVHVIERRRFDTDLRRHFIGEVQGVEGGVMRVSGYTFVYDPGRTAYTRLNERRTRIISLESDGIIINVVSIDTNLDDVRYEEVEGRLVATDGGSMRLDINEFGRNR